MVLITIYIVTHLTRLWSPTRLGGYNSLPYNFFKTRIKMILEIHLFLLDLNFALR